MILRQHGDCLVQDRCLAHSRHLVIMNLYCPSFQFPFVLEVLFSQRLERVCGVYILEGLTYGWG